MVDINLLQKGDLAASDFSNDDTNNKGGIKVKLSPDDGNLLQKRNNGLYYGIEAPPDTRHLYVSSSTGSDSNKGTRAEPLQTIREAFRRNNVGTRFTIFLHEDDEHEVRGSWGFFATRKGAEIYPYGPVLDSINRRNPVGSWVKWLSTELKRPVIKAVADGSIRFEGRDVEVFGMAESNSVDIPISFYGITIDTSATADLPVILQRNSLINSRSVESSFVRMVGCDVILGDSFFFFNSRGPSSLYVQGVLVNADKGNKLINLDATSALNINIIGSRTPREEKVSTEITPAGQEPLTTRAHTPIQTLSQYITNYNADRVLRYTLSSNIDLG